MGFNSGFKGLIEEETKRKSKEWKDKKRGEVKNNERHSDAVFAAPCK